MNDNIPIRDAESMPVQLTRMEGVLNLIVYKTDDMVKRVGHIESGLTKMQAEVQRLQLEAAARDSTAKALQEALDGENVRRKDLSEARWTPFQRWLTTLATTAVLVNLWFAIFRR